jgi:hypothetical protein
MRLSFSDSHSPSTLEGVPCRLPCVNKFRAHILASPSLTKVFWVQLCADYTTLLQYSTAKTCGPGFVFMGILATRVTGREPLLWVMPGSLYMHLLRLGILQAVVFSIGQVSFISTLSMFELDELMVL